MSGLEVNNWLFRDALKDYIKLAKNWFKKEREVLWEDIWETATEKLDNKVNTWGMIEIEYSVEWKKKAKKIKVSEEMNSVIKRTGKKIIDAWFKWPDIPKDHRMLWKQWKTVFIETEVRKELNTEGGQAVWPKFKEVITLSLEDKRPFDITLHYSWYDEWKYFDIVKKPNWGIDIVNSNWSPWTTFKPKENGYVTRQEVEDYIANTYWKQHIPQNLKLLFPDIA